MKTIYHPLSALVRAPLAAAIGLCFISMVESVRAHCDGMDGPVVKAAQQALADGDVHPALIWVSKADEAEIVRAFQQALAVRKLGSEAKELADRYFFETLVRVHRAGEGAPYTGLKPAGRDLGPAIPLGDKAIDTGDIAPVVALLSKAAEHGLRERFEQVTARKKFATNDVSAGREFVHAYVEYIHYVEGVYQAARGAAAAHPGEHGPAAAHEHGDH